DDDKRPLVLLDRGALGWRNARQNIVDRARQLAPVHDELTAELEDVGSNLGGVFAVTLASLLQDIKRQNGALPRINPVRIRIEHRVEVRWRVSSYCAALVGHLVLLTRGRE